MPILAIFTGDISKADYEKVRAEVNWEEHHADGGVFHCASFDENDHIHVADVWESAEALNTFVEQRLGPAMQKLQISPPDVAVFPTHNINAYASIEAFRI